jgi:plasmid stabilization system protein ParE
MALPDGPDAGWLNAIIAWGVAQFAAVLVWGARLEIRMRNVEKTAEVVQKIERDVAVLADRSRLGEQSMRGLHRKLDRLLEGRREGRSFRDDEDQD